MNDNQLQFVTFDQAKRLKELGFDWKCYMRYDDERLTKSYISNHNALTLNDVFSAPTMALVLKWCRDVKKIVIQIRYLDGYYGYMDGEETEIFSTYDPVESALLDMVLDKLNSSKNDTNDPC